MVCNADDEEDDEDDDTDKDKADSAVARSDASDRFDAPPIRAAMAAAKVVGGGGRRGSGEEVDSDNEGNRDDNDDDADDDDDDDDGGDTTDGGDETTETGDTMPLLPLPPSLAFSKILNSSRCTFRRCVDSHSAVRTSENAADRHAPKATRSGANDER
jgi:hypothetical protein